MQYHFDGFRTGDPHVQPRAEVFDKKHVDVAIIGCGPAGLTLAAQLAAFPDIRTRIFERKDGPLKIGQADGIACRSMEMFEAFGFADKVAKEAYWVNETVFWRSDGMGQLYRADRIQDVEDGLSEMPHTILSQARIHDFFLECMRNSPHRMEPDYGVAFAGFEREDEGEFPLKLTLKSDPDKTYETVHAKYLVGCDGARSAVRTALGLRLEGTSARQLWGVMDVLVSTDFPDIRLKCAVQSASNGSVLIIPREGGAMVRTYVELDSLRGNERASDRNVTADYLIERVRKVFAPYRFDVKEVAWSSAYEIGQRCCPAFDDGSDAPRVFIAGDACHTHSPKAGQGMNVSMADTFNLGWKLAAVLRGQAHPRLLRTYSAERQAKAAELIAFDHDMARLFSSKDSAGKQAAEFQTYFQKHARYTAGVETRYDPSIIVAEPQYQHLAAGFQIGTRFHSAPVIRLADAKPLHLGHAFKADGRWRVLFFAPQLDTGEADGAVARACAFLQNDPSSPLQRFSKKSHDLDALIDVRAVFQAPHRDMAFEALPALLRPPKGRLELTDYEKVFCPDLKSGQDIFDLRSIDRQQGATVILRPDQYVAHVLPLGACEELGNFFARALE